ncbi:cuticle protein 7-like [Danaus plexippus]|uniref:cuticle protein 7-like n=1 Tax=Danaus plexippus TaxID=13037 RepID=UPI002AB1B9E8|nr:cuticle protein 7-like [Danaus plexippus]
MEHLSTVRGSVYFLLKKSKVVAMFLLHVCLLLTTCVIIEADYIGYPREGYGYYPGYGTYRTAYKDYSGDAQGNYYAYPKYNYDYSVNDPHTGDHKTAWEVRDGDVVRGAYSVAEADGTTRLVEYTADKLSGFKAVVKRIGQPYHTEVYPKQYEAVHTYSYQ